MVTDMASLSRTIRSLQGGSVALVLVAAAGLSSCSDPAPTTFVVDLEPPLRRAVEQAILAGLGSDVTFLSHGAPRSGRIERGPVVSPTDTVARGLVVLATSDAPRLVPRSFRDIVANEFAGRVAVPDPRTSEVGYLLLAALSRHYGWGWFHRLHQIRPVVLPDEGAVLAAVQAGRADVGIASLAAVLQRELRHVIPEDGGVPYAVNVRRSANPDDDRVGALLHGRPELIADLGFYPALTPAHGSPGIPDWSAVPRFPFDEAARHAAVRRRAELITLFEQIFDG